jgi:amino acid transporter
MNRNKLIKTAFAAIVAAVILIIIVTGLTFTAFNFIKDFNLYGLSGVINGWVMIIILILIILFAFSGLGICVYLFENVEEIHDILRRIKNKKTT